MSLLQAQINTDTSSPLYLTQDLSNVYTDTDPRTYELSSYSYMILPTDTNFGFTSDKGYTLGAFGSYLLCQGQQQVDQLGYSALPINLVEAGYTQLAKIPGAQVPTTTRDILAGCANPDVYQQRRHRHAGPDRPVPARLRSAGGGPVRAPGRHFRRRGHHDGVGRVAEPGDRGPGGDADRRRGARQRQRRSDGVSGVLGRWHGYRGPGAA